MAPSVKEYHIVLIKEIWLGAHSCAARLCDASATLRDASAHCVVQLLDSIH